MELSSVVSVMGDRPVARPRGSALPAQRIHAPARTTPEWNYGPGWEDALIAAYGIAPDHERLAYYRELWNAT